MAPGNRLRAPFMPMPPPTRWLGFVVTGVPVAVVVAAGVVVVAVVGVVVVDVAGCGFSGCCAVGTVAAVFVGFGPSTLAGLAVCGFCWSIEVGVVPDAWVAGASGWPGLAFGCVALAGGVDGAAVCACGLACPDSCVPCVGS